MVAQVLFEILNVLKLVEANNLVSCEIRRVRTSVLGDQIFAFFVDLVQTFEFEDSFI